MSKNNRWLFRAVQGNLIGGDSYMRNATKIVYSVDIQPLVRSYNADGRIQCDLTNGISLDGDADIEIPAAEAAGRLANGEQVADCPRAISSLVVPDQSTGGPHFASLDNYTLTAEGYPTRLLFADYFVSRTGIDGNHHVYLANIDRRGRLSFDESFRDEVTGEVGINFNRTDWPESPGAGFYKPHSMVWVCPPGICTDETAVLDAAQVSAPAEH